MGNFDEIHNRVGSSSMKWDRRQTVFGTDDVLPLWVADMDFKAPDAVNDVLKARAEHGIYGYTFFEDDTYAAVKGWLGTRHGWDIQKDWLTFSPGVITSLHLAIQLFTDVDDKIVIQTPVYTPFFNLVKGGKRTLVENELIYENGTYRMDLADLELSFKDGARAMIFCSPHNPVGRVWSRDELDGLAALCKKYDVLILSDEIHADLVFDPNKHITLASLSDDMAARTITMMSATKTFNLAGLQSSYMVVPDQAKRIKLQNELNLLGFSMLNTFGTIAIEAVYRYGTEWLDELMEVLAENRQYVIDELEGGTQGKLKVIRSEGTYLLWVDCSALGLDAKALQQFMIEKARVGLNAGAAYGKPGEAFMRINIACPMATLKEAMERIVEAIRD